jgi:hypothetical protein
MPPTATLSATNDKTSSSAGRERSSLSDKPCPGKQTACHTIEAFEPLVAYN